MKPIIGIDLDNTIIDYDCACYSLALEREIIPVTVPPTKNGVRDFLRQQGREPLWTELQGILYGPEIYRATPFGGVLSFLANCKKKKIPIYIISHKTKYPFVGEKYDLHHFSMEWLKKNNFFELIPSKNIFLETTKEKKVERINRQQCSFFIDDLPEFLELIPKNIHKILFDPQHAFSKNKECTIIDNWERMQRVLP